MKTLVDLIIDEVKSSINNSSNALSPNRSSSTVSNTNVISRQNQTTFRTKRMWTPGKLFTDDYYFSGYPVEPTDEFHNSD